MTTNEYWNGVAEGADAAPTPEASASPPEGGEDPSWTDYATDIPRGVVAGGIGMVQSVGKLADDLSNTIGFGHIVDPEFFKPVIKTKTWVGGLTEGLTQFALAFIPIGGAAGAVSKAAKLGEWGAAAMRLGAGALTDFVAFDDTRGRLSDLIQKYPTLQNPVTDFLSTKADDSWAASRLKNSLEGLGIVGLTEGATKGIVKSFQGFKKMLGYREAGDAVAMAAAGKELGKELEPHAQDLTDSLDSLEGITGAQAVVSGVDPIIRLKKSATGIKPSEMGQVRDSIIDEALKNVSNGVPFLSAATDAFRSHLNIPKLTSTGSREQVLTVVNNVVSGLLEKAGASPESLEAVEKAAQDLVKEYGGNIQAMINSAKGDAAATDQLNRRFLAYTIVRNSVADEIFSYTPKYRDAFDWTSGTPVIKSKETVNEFMELVASFADLHFNTQMVQTNTSRVVTAGNVYRGGPANVNSDKLAKLLVNATRGKVKGVDPAALMQTLAMSAKSEDPSTFGNILRIFDKHSNTAMDKVVGVHNQLFINALFGIKTQTTNFIGQLSQTLLMPANVMVGGSMNADMETVKFGTRLYTGLLSSVFDMFHMTSVAGGAPPISTARSVFRTAFSADGESALGMMAKAEVSRKAISGQNLVPFLDQSNPIAVALNWLGRAVDLPSRFMQTIDTLFREINYRSYLRADAMAAADKAGLKTAQEYTDFVGRRMAEGFTPSGSAIDSVTGNPLHEAAWLYSQRSTNTQPLLEGTLGKTAQNAVVKHPALRAFMPFIRTPTNIYRNLVQYTPGIDLIQQEFRQNWASKDPVVAADAMGKFFLGGLFWTMAGGVALSGKITGSGPANPEERNLWLQTGARPYSYVKENQDGTKEYIEYRRMEPFGMVLGLAADFIQVSKHLEDNDNLAIAQAMTVALAKNVTSRTYLTGLAELADALGKPDEFAGRFIQNRIAAYYPSSLAPLNDGNDYMRETRGIMDRLMAKIPGLSETLPPRRNLFGEAVPVPEGFLPFSDPKGFAKYVSPLGYSKAVPDPVKDELSSLQFAFSPPGKRYMGVDLSMFKDKGGQDAYDRLLQLHGQVQIGGKTLQDSLKGLIESDQYQQLPKPQSENDNDNPRVRAVRSVLSAYRRASQGTLLRERPEILDILKQAQQHRVKQTPVSPILSRFGIK